MSKTLHFSNVTTMQAVSAVNQTLRRIDERLIDHGERVAYLACQFAIKGNLNLDLKTLFLLSAFHDIGAYKTDEIDRMLEFETRDVWNHSIYGYLFLKHMTPLLDSAQAILYHHASWETIQRANCSYDIYAELIHLADRIDVLLTYHKDASLFDHLFSNNKHLYSDDLLALVKSCLEQEHFLDAVKNGSYHDSNMELISSFSTSVSEALAYLEMVVYSIDFLSEHTVTHTINTVSIALSIARHFKLSEEEQEKIYLGALLHDVGKIAIPVSILEYPGRLSDKDMVVMRTHVVETRKLIEGIISPEICELASRHHEKLDGSGYPQGLSAKELTFSQRIIAVADIVSALSSRRSYKEPFPKEKTISILEGMKGIALDSDICDYVCTNYSAILEASEPDRLEVIERYQSMTREFKVLQTKLTYS